MRDPIKTVSGLHNLSVKQIEDYFDKEVIEKLKKNKMSTVIN